MTHSQIREKFLKFFESRGHKIVPSSSLLPTDPSVLFTTAGMQQFKPYFTGQADPLNDFGTKRVASIQKAMRTSDIDEVGDKSHLTFFEMLGHFSFGDYFKRETIQWTYQFLTEELKIDKYRISATVFTGDEKIPFDSESYDVWAELLSEDKIKRGPREDNVWGPAGPEGPCGAANEVYVDELEVATLVFMEYNCAKDGTLTPLPQKGVDVGWGFERIVQIVQNKESVFEIDLLDPIIKLVPMELDDRVKRIITDHSRAIAFLITDGVRPSNKEQGYVLRRLMRRVITYFYVAKADLTLTHDIFAKIVEIHNSRLTSFSYSQEYENDVVELNADLIIHEFDNEKGKFEKAFSAGKKELKKIYPIKGVDPENSPGIIGNIYRIPGSEIYRIYESTGLYPELAQELMKSWGMEFDQESLREAEKIHQEKSRAGAEKKFGGHGLLMDTGELKAGNEEELKKATRLHTATHLLHASLRKVLGTEVKQAGSDITPERLRFDFTFPRKMTPEEIKQAEDMINEAVQKDYPVTKEEMSYEDAIKSGAMAFFKLKYPNRVNVYTIGPEPVVRSTHHGEPVESVEGQNPSSSNSSGPPFSRELCGGPHVSHSAEIGRVKITKEESVSAGVRRIRATVE